MNTVKSIFIWQKAYYSFSLMEISIHESTVDIDK